MTAGSGTQRFVRIAAGLLVCLAAGALSSIAVARSGSSGASAAYYYYCPGGGAGSNYGYCPPTTTTTTTPNSPPVVTAAADQTSDEGQAKSFELGSFSDANNNGPWEVTVTWGDGSPPETFVVANEGALPNRTHTYADNGVYTVTVRVEDAAGASDTDTFQVTVGNLPPSCGPLAVTPASPVGVGTPVVATAPFTDPGTADTHTASISWGDGTSSSGIVTEASGSGNVSGTHTYTAAGSYTVTLTVTDDDGASGTCTFQFVIVQEMKPGKGCGDKNHVHERENECKITPRSVAAREGNTGATSFTFTISLDLPPIDAVTVAYSTVPGTAKSGSDFSSRFGLITFPPGVTTRTVTVTVLGDKQKERDEAFTLWLFNVSPNAILLQSTASGTILNDD